MNAQSFIRVVSASTLLFVYSGTAEAINVLFTTPSIGQDYGINAPISYTGNVTWGQFEGATVTIQVDYMYGSSDSTGRILDSEEAVWTYRDVQNRSGAWKNKNPATLTATQWNGNSSTYFLAATPYTATSPYFNPDMTIYYVDLELGDVS